MKNLIDVQVYEDNGVLVPEAGDPVQGAVTGALFGGVGQNNVPHQQLADRTAWLKAQVLFLAGALTMLSQPTDADGMPSGAYYVRIPTDVALNGAPQPVLAVSQYLQVCWGAVTWTGAPTFVQFDFFWPHAFSTKASGGGLFLVQAQPVNRSVSSEPDFRVYWQPALSTNLNGVFTVFTSGALLQRTFTWVAIGAG